MNGLEYAQNELNNVKIKYGFDFVNNPLRLLNESSLVLYRRTVNPQRQ